MPVNKNVILMTAVRDTKLALTATVRSGSLPFLELAPPLVSRATSRRTPFSFRRRIMIVASTGLAAPAVVAEVRRAANILSILWMIALVSAPTVPIA